MSDQEKDLNRSSGQDQVTDFGDTIQFSREELLRERRQNYQRIRQRYQHLDEDYFDREMARASSLSGGLQTSPRADQGKAEQEDFREQADLESGSKTTQANLKTRVTDKGRSWLVKVRGGLDRVKDQQSNQLESSDLASSSQDPLDQKAGGVEESQKAPANWPKSGVDQVTSSLAKLEGWFRGPSSEAGSQELSADDLADSLPIITIDDRIDPEAALEIEENLDLESDQASDVVSGASWLTLGSIMSRVLGALYVIPWAYWMGAEFTTANSLMSLGYKPYALFLAIATAGFPSAMAKLLAYFHARKEFRVADKLFKHALVIMLVTGLITGAALYALAPTLAANTPTTDPQAGSQVIRALVPALLILPVMSLLRGYFQGYKDMKPTALSQIIEQALRVVYMLAATYMIMQVYSGDVSQAVVHSSFAAFVGALGSFIYLALKYWRALPAINAQIADHPGDYTINFKTSTGVLLRDSIPFILLGSGIIIAQTIDTYTFGHIMRQTSVLLMTEIAELYGTFSHDVDKLVMIIVSLAVAIATAAVPSVSASYSKDTIQKSSSLIQHIVTLFALVMLPAAFGMAGVSGNIYRLFYLEGSSKGPELLVTGALMSIFLGAFTVFSMILQSMNHRRLAIRYLLIGLLVKALVQYPFIAILNAHGALLATGLAFMVTSLLMLLEIFRHLDINYIKLRQDLMIILILSLTMLATVVLWTLALDRLLGPTARLLSLVKVLVTVGVGIFTYGLGLGLLGKLDLVLGQHFADLQDKLRLF